MFLIMRHVFDWLSEGFDMAVVRERAIALNDDLLIYQDNDELWAAVIKELDFYADVGGDHIPF